MLTYSNRGGNLELNCHKNKGFTLIELLAVIVILAIIAVIATPTITDLIEDSKKSSFEKNIEGVVEATKFDITDKLIDNGYTYDIVDGTIEGLTENVKISNSKGINGTIQYNSDGEVSYAIHNDKWCVVKKNDEVTTTEYNGECVLEVSTVAEAFTYEEVENGISLTDYDINKGGVDIVIPSTINGKKVVAIGNRAFAMKTLLTETSMLNKENIKFMSNQEDKEIAVGVMGGDIKSIVIPNTVKRIGAEAFSNNKLTSVVIPNSVISIGYSAFSNNKLTSVNISNNITTIEALAFEYNQLTSITLPEGVTSIGESAFKSNKLTSIIIPKSVTTISDEAFYMNRLSSVTLPENLKTIGERSFADNQLTSVTIPKSVLNVGISAFSKKGWTNPNLTKIINKTGYLFNWGNIINGTSGYEFITGTVENDYGNVEITNE